MVAVADLAEENKTGDISEAAEQAHNYVIDLHNHETGGEKTR